MRAANLYLRFLFPAPLKCCLGFGAQKIGVLPQPCFIICLFAIVVFSFAHNRNSHLPAIPSLIHPTAGFDSPLLEKQISHTVPRCSMENRCSMGTVSDCESRPGPQNSVKISHFRLFRGMREGGAFRNKDGGQARDGVQRPCSRLPRTPALPKNPFVLRFCKLCVDIQGQSYS